jgi:hypothetical protein
MEKNEEDMEKYADLMKEIKRREKIFKMWFKKENNNLKNRIPELKL